VDPNKTLIIGYGNSLRGDDGAGPLVARAFGPGAIAANQLTPELAEPIASAGLVIFVDADATLEPGNVRRVDVCASSDDGPLEHHASPANLLRIAADVYGATPRAVLISIGGEEFGLRQGLSSPARVAVEKAIQEVRECMNPGS
jgi:hydrogenase maturation protease